jgi:Tn3 transposase DDE domain
VSINTGEVSAHDVTRMISRDGRPTALGEAVAHYGRIYKTLHILRLADDEPYRREGKRQSNLTEGRHDLARNIYHGKKGEMHQAYYEGMEDQLSALGLVLNCVVLWNTVLGLEGSQPGLRHQAHADPNAVNRRLNVFATCRPTRTRTSPTPDPGPAAPRRCPRRSRAACCRRRSSPGTNPVVTGSAKSAVAQQSPLKPALAGPRFGGGVG